MRNIESAKWCVVQEGWYMFFEHFECARKEAERRHHPMNPIASIQIRRIKE